MDNMLVKKIIAVVMVIFLFANLLFLATGKLELSVFWFSLGVVALVSFLFYKN